MGLYALTHVNIVSTGSTGTDSDMLGFVMPGFEPRTYEHGNPDQRLGQWAMVIICHINC